MKFRIAICSLVTLLAALCCGCGQLASSFASRLTAKAPGCLEMLGYTTTEDENGTASISGSIRNNCDRDFIHVQVTFQLDRANENDFSAGLAYAYGSDLKPGATWEFKSALPVAKDAAYRLGEITAY